MRIGLLGGTFDPPHLGHLVVAAAVRDSLELDEVWLLVAGDPWMKDSESPAEHRVAMCQLAADGMPGLVTDDRETRREGDTFTADTLGELRDQRPDDDFTFIVGTDTAARMTEWGRVDEALDLAEWVVVGRPGTVWPDHRLMHRLQPVEIPGIDVSSTWARDQVRLGRWVRPLVPDPVIAYIEEHGLYASRP